MPFRATFTCLWCGADHTTRGPDDLEGWAQLCPDCLGLAGDNEFLRFRLRQALGERGAAAKGAEGAERSDGRVPEDDDWYRRRGRYSFGPIHDAAWDAELDAAGRWLDGLPIAGEIVELAAGIGWWSPLLASKGEASLYDPSEAPLAHARERLVAHGLRAHLHVRDAWAEPDRPVDVLFTGFWLSHVPPERLPAFFALARRWLKPDGLFAFIDSLDDPQSGALERAATVHHGPAVLAAALAEAGFEARTVTNTGRFFVLGVGLAG